MKLEQSWFVLVCVAGDPTIEDLETLFSLGCLSSQGSQSRSSWSQSGLKTKGFLKQEKRKSSDGKGPPDSTHTHGKDNLSKAQEKDSKSSRGLAEATNDAEPPDSEVSQEVQFPKLQQPEVDQEVTSNKLQKPESRRGPKREAPGPEHEPLTRHKRDNDSEQDERRRKKRSEVTDSLSSQVKNRFGPKHFEKTVSIRLVDIRNTDTDDYYLDEAVTKRSSSISLDATTNAKLNKPNLTSDAVTATKANGWLKKTQSNSSHTPNGHMGAHLRGWGKFRIPKRSEKEEQKALLRPLTNTPETPYPRTRLRTGTENNRYAPDSKAGEGDVEPCLKRCHSHQLRGNSSLSRRYGPDIIRRGVLAS